MVCLKYWLLGAYSGSHVRHADQRTRIIRLFERPILVKLNTWWNAEASGKLVSLENFQADRRKRTLMMQAVLFRCPGSRFLPYTATKATFTGLYWCMLKKKFVSKIFFKLGIASVLDKFKEKEKYGTLVIFRHRYPASWMYIDYYSSQCKNERRKKKLWRRK